MQGSSTITSIKNSLYQLCSNIRRQVGGTVECCLLEHKPAWTAWSLNSVVLALAIEVEAHRTNHNILSRYRGITAKHTPVTAVNTGFQENIMNSRTALYG